MTNHLSPETIQALRDYVDPIINELDYLEGQYREFNSQYWQADREFNQALTEMDALKVAEAEQRRESLGKVLKIARTNYENRRKELGKPETAYGYADLIKDVVWPDIEEIEREDWVKVEALAKELIELRESMQERRRQINEEVVTERKKLHRRLGEDSYFASFAGLNTQPCGYIYVGRDDKVVATHLNGASK